MGGCGSVPMAVQCVPERVLNLISHYAEELEFGSVEDLPIRLRECSRRDSIVPCVLWWKVVDKSLTCVLPKSFIADRCRMVSGLSGRRFLNPQFAFSDHGAGCMVSRTWTNDCLHFRVGAKSVWIWRNFQLALGTWGWLATESESGGNMSIFSFDPFHSVLAVNSRYILGCKLFTGYIDQSVMQYDSSRNSTTWRENFDPQFHPFANPPPQMPIAAAFTDDTSMNYLYVTRDLKLFSVSFETKSKIMLLDLDAAAVSIRRLHNHRSAQNSNLQVSQPQIHSWGSTLLRERSSFVFAFRASLSMDSAPPFLYMQLMRFAILPETKKTRVLGFWCSHDLSPGTLTMRLRLRKHCTLDIAPPGSSVLACQYEDRLVTFDNRTLKGNRCGLRLTQKHKGQFRYPRVLSRFTKNKSLELVIQGIRNSKEKRLLLCLRSQASV